MFRALVKQYKKQNMYIFAEKVIDDTCTRNIFFYNAKEICILAFCQLDKIKRSNANTAPP